VDSRTEPGTTQQTDPSLPDRAAASEPGKGDTIGRFVVLEELGRGGMGLVVAAWDPELDRKVALKLLRPELTPADGGTEARARLKREAQAMAKLRHPNVVAVYEVGEYGDQLFLAMEYVPGGNLATWADARRGKPGRWREIVAAYAEAGRGLVAAHERGLIHRDFKPANVLVDGDRFQVTDFGIASLRRGTLLAGSQRVRDVCRGLGPLQTFGDTVDAPAANASALSEPSLTRTGLLMGTAPYMAPERHRSEPADALTDQFAFCAALYEGLYGQRAFAGKTTTAIAQAILDGHVQPPPPSSDVPEFVRRAVLRGLSLDPADRWPTMADLLRTLIAPDEADVGRRTRVFIGVLLGTTFAVLPVLNARYGLPFDTLTYTGNIAQACMLLALLGALAYWARESMRATPRNRQTFAVLLALFALQIPFEIGHAVLGVPILDSHVMHLFYWGSVASVYAAVADLRMLPLGLLYIAAYLVAANTPQHVSWIAAVTNACFVVNALVLNRHHRRRRRT
jgi:serine/threonine protein kinase